MKQSSENPSLISRRRFLRDCFISASALVSLSTLGCRSLPGFKTSGVSGPASRNFSLDQDWLFGGKFDAVTLEPAFDDQSFSRITLPHCVTKLSWQGWNLPDWEDVWIYRRHFSIPKAFNHRRVFLDFDGVMNTARPAINGLALPVRNGGYLPFSYEITEHLRPGDNVLAVAVDARWNSVPPDGNPKGPISVDYLEAGGLVRSVSLRAVPQIFISDVFAKPVDVLDSNRRVELTCTVDAAMVPERPLHLKADLLKNGRVIASTTAGITKITQPGTTEIPLLLSDFGNIKLWDVEAPQLYDVVVTLLYDDIPLHDYRTRIGFRDARFEVDGFFLNGRRLCFMGLNRHEIFPYVGFAMPPRVMRRDAELLRHEFNCNIVRCSHYPQTRAFLDACDELGMMVWEETPGWNYLGDAAWKDLAIRDVGEMIRRDRNHPSIVIWGVRVNESKNDPALYERTTALAKALDDSRPTSGSMTVHSTKDWKQDIFALDDYHAAPDGSVGIYPPLPDVPYMLSECVGQFSYGGSGKGFHNYYRRAGDLRLQMDQALYHAQAHDRARAYPRMAGVIGWCAFEYASLTNGCNGLKYPGIADFFRIPKLGASFYQAQVSPLVRMVIQPSFYWDLGPQSPQGPGKHAAIFSNCDRLEIFVGGGHIKTAWPDSVNYPHLEHPPFFCDLEIADSIAQARPDLRIEGYLEGKLAFTRKFSSDASKDDLFLSADDTELFGDGIDATRLVFQVVDRYGANRALAGGAVTIEIKGHGMVVGDNPFMLKDSGGAGAVWIKTMPNSSGKVTVMATHTSLGSKSLNLDILPDPRSEKI